MADNNVCINILIITDNLFEWTEKIAEDLPFATTIMNNNMAIIYAKYFHFIIRKSFSVACCAYKAHHIIIDKPIYESEQRRLASNVCQNITYTKQFSSI